MNCFVGVDVGTTNMKALAVSPDDVNQILAEASAPVQTVHPKPGFAEQDVKAIWLGFREIMASLMQQLRQANHTPTHLTFSTAMHSLLAMDEAGEPLSTAILWSDNRAEPQAEALRLTQKPIGRKLYVQSGAPIHPMLPLCKLRWLQEHEPRLLHRAARWGSIKEYLWHRLTGFFEVDYAIAAATGMFDATKKTWSSTALTYTGIGLHQLSALQPTTHQRPLLNSSALKGLQLPQNLTLILGASDGCLANLGAGAIRAGITTLTIGTSGAIRQTTNKPIRDAKGRLFCYPLDEKHYVVGGPTNNGANVLEWVAEKLAHLQPEAVLAAAQKVPVGSDGLMFMPYLQGERAPFWDADIRGVYWHVGWQHTQAHFLRAALEGVLFNLLSINQLLVSHLGASHTIHANGGFARSAFWVQMLADMSGLPVRLNTSNESGSMGAILLSLTATGHYTSLEEAAKQVAFGKTFQPNQQNMLAYQQLYRNWLAARQKLFDKPIQRKSNR